jgi:outer membrane receptor protein involved in Fe transport
LKRRPLPGLDLRLDQIPAPVHTALSADIDASGALDLSDFLNRRFNGVFVNEIEGNPFQPDLNYRGYTASPLLGTPQGLSIYMDGVRPNQPFGDVVSWDLIPRLAIGSTTLMSGSNPLYGLNTLGGALSIQTKDGRSNPGTSVRAIYGSGVRRALEVEHGGSRGNGLNWYLAGNVFAEDGWRDDSPSSVGQFFGKLGRHEPGSETALSFGYADTSLKGNGLQEQRFLNRDFASVYTKPDKTDNRSTLVNLMTRHDRSASLTFSGNIHYRNIRTNTFNGDINGDALSGDAEYNGLLNRSDIAQHDYGPSGQVTWRDWLARRNVVTVGAGYDGSRSTFEQSSQFGHLNADRSVTPVDAFDDDKRVSLAGRVNTGSLFASDVLSLGVAWSATVSARYNRTSVSNADRLNPGGGPGSLDGDHSYGRLNPAAGVTFSPSHAVNVYFGYSEGSRTPTSVELGCANSDQPCRLPNALAGDPPLEQVVTRTFEAGIRGGTAAITWSAGIFHANNLDDILFVASPQTGFGYFKNFGKTRRQGIEVQINARRGGLAGGLGYTYLNATFESAEMKRLQVLGQIKNRALERSSPIRFRRSMANFPFNRQPFTLPARRPRTGSELV